MGAHYNSRMPVLIGTVALAAGMVFADVEYNPARYDLILDRAPFGADPLQGGDSAADDAREAAEAQAAAEAAAKEVRLCFLFRTKDGEIRAGFENMRAKPGDPSNPKNIILRVGESFKGMKLSDIDLENSQAILERSGRRVMFELSKAPTAAQPSPQKAEPQRRFGGGFRRTTPPAQPAKPPEPELTPEEQEQQRAQIRKNLEEYQMEVIRTGLPPLPIPLTQEMDDQLVAEGVLPPQ